MKLVHCPSTGGLLHSVQRGGDWAGPQPAQAPPRSAGQRSTATVPITVLQYNGPLLCGFNMGTKGSSAAMVIASAGQYTAVKQLSSYTEVIKNVEHRLSLKFYLN